MARSKKAKFFNKKRKSFKELKALCSDYDKDYKTVISKFFDKKPTPLSKGGAKIERQLNAHMFVRKDAHHIVTLRHNLIDKSIGEHSIKSTPNRTVLIARAFNNKNAPYEHLTFNRMGSFLNGKQYTNKSRKVA